MKRKISFYDIIAAAVIASVMNCVSVFSADDFPDSIDYPWQCGDAPFRLAVYLETPGQDFYLDTHKLCFPAPMDNGVKVYDEFGSEVRHHQFDDSGILLPSVDKPSVRYVYFGFDSKQDFSKWPSAPENKRLRLMEDASRRLPLTPEKWLEAEIKKRNDTIERNAKSSNAWKDCDVLKSGCPAVNRYLRKCKNSVLPLCGRNILFEGIFNNSLLQNHNPAVHTCCTFAVFNPDYAIPVSHVQCIRERTLHALRQYVKLKNKQLAEIEEVKTKDATASMEEELFKLFSTGRPKEIQAVQVFLPKRPFDTGQRFTVLYKGNLYVPETGDYEFSVTTNSTRFLRIDGKTLIREFGETPNTEIIGTVNEVKVHLERGIHSYELYYHKEQATTWITAGWRPAGSTAPFEILKEENFYPAAPARIIDCRSKAGLRYPVVLRNDGYSLFPGKDERLLLDRYRLVFPEKMSFQWEIDSRLYPDDFTALVLKDYQTPAVRLIPDDPSFGAIPVTRYEREIDKVSVRTDLSQIPVIPDVMLKIWTPQFLFDDEILDFFIEVRSRIPLAMKVDLSQKPDQPNTVFPERSDLLDVPPMLMEYSDRFASDVMIKRNVKADGSRIKTPVNVDYSVSVPEFTFDKKRISVIPVEKITGMKTDRDGLVTPDGRRLVPLLHRPTLNDLRAWELPRLIGKEFSQIKKVFIVAEEFGTFRYELESRFAALGIATEFFAWGTSPGESGNPMLESMGPLLRKIKATDADAGLVVMPSYAKRLNVSVREDSRIAAFVVELMRRHSKIREVKLTAPVPAPERLNTAANEKRLTDELQGMTRSYEVEVIGLSLPTSPGTDSEALHFGSGGDENENLRPVKYADGMAETIVRTFREKQ